MDIFMDIWHFILKEIKALGTKAREWLLCSSINNFPCLSGKDFSLIYQNTKDKLAYTVY